MLRLLKFPGNINILQSTSVSSHLRKFSFNMSLDLSELYQLQGKNENKMKEVAEELKKGDDGIVDRLRIELLKEREMLKEKLKFYECKVRSYEAKKGITQVPLPNGISSCTSASSAPVPPSSKEEKTEVVEKPVDQIPQTGKKNAKEKPVKNKKPEVVEEVDVRRLDFRVGRIVSVEKHPDADTLYVEKIDLGEQQPRTVVSGLVNFIPLQDMQNRLVVALCNLKPVKMRGILSEAMVMCASTPEKVEILNPPQNAVPGDRVTCSEYVGKPDDLLNPKKKIFEQVAPFLKTNGDAIATYKASPLAVEGKGVVRADTLTNVQIK